MVPTPFRFGSQTAAFPILLIGCLLIASCSGPSAGISGHIEGGENAEVRLAGLGQRGFMDIDTVTADGAGQFNIPATSLQGLALDVYKVSVGDGHFFVIGDSLSSLQVEGKLPEQAGLITDLGCRRAMHMDRWICRHSCSEFDACVSDSLAEAKKQMAASQGTSAQEQNRRQAAPTMPCRDRHDRLCPQHRSRATRTDPVGLMALRAPRPLTADRPLAKHR